MINKGKIEILAKGYDWINLFPSFDYVLPSPGSKPYICVFLDKKNT